MPAPHLSAAAEDDLAAIARYIGVEKQSPRAARDFIDAFYERCEAYARQPGMGEPRADLDDDLRSFTFKRNYVVIYRPIPGGIDVLRVFHGARDYTRWFRGGEA